METKIVVRNEDLWQRIQEFSLDKHDVDFPFSKKLAKEENWTADFTQKAIEEYKKFIYMCCILPNGASPSDIIDKVWHMHLMYTYNYWEEFCPNILKQRLHHYPSKGGSDEKKKHHDWFRDTLSNYELIFETKAPDEIWLCKKGRSGNRKLWLNRVKLFSILTLFFILGSCSDNLGNFLSTIFVIIPLAFLMISAISKMSSQNNNPKNQNKNNSGDSGFGCSSDSSSGCSSSCGSSCGGGCGGCGGGGD